MPTRDDDLHEQYDLEHHVPVIDATTIRARLTAENAAAVDAMLATWFGETLGD